MIGRISGRLVDKLVDKAVVDVGGVGFELLMSTNSLGKLPPKRAEVTLLTYLHVREDTLQLFGFLDPAEKELFEQLITVSGIGPKVALGVLSAFSVAALKKAIITEDLELLTAIPGVGKKSASRLILELKDKLAMPELEVVGLKDRPSSSYAEVKSALINLGYSSAEATKALEELNVGAETSAEELLKKVLRHMASS